MNYNIYCSWCGSRIFETDRTCARCGAPINVSAHVYQESKPSNSESVDKSEAFTILAGQDISFSFNVFEEDKVTPFDFTHASVFWVMFPYGNPEKIAWTIQGEIVRDGLFVVHVDGEHTAGLDGLFIYQVEMLSQIGKRRLGQGLIKIIPSLLKL